MRTEYFPTKPKALAVANQNPNAEFVDLGKDKERGKRWAVKVRETRKARTKGQSTKPTKKEQAVEIVNKELSKGKSRQEILEVLENKVELSPQGASTYYYNIKSGIWH